MRKSAENNKQHGEKEQHHPQTSIYKPLRKYRSYYYVMDFQDYIKFLEDFEKEFRQQD